MNIEKGWQKKFDEGAKKDKDDYQIAQWSKESLDAYVEYFFIYFDSFVGKNNSNRLLLDVGCGPATFLKVLAEKDFKTFGVDYSSAMIEVAKERCRGQKISFQVANACNLPFEENSFDIVICLGVFQTVENQMAALKEINRVLKKEGIFIMTTLNKFSLGSILKKNNPEVLRFNPYKFKKMVEKENFYEVKIKGIYFFPQSLSFITNFILKHKFYIFFNWVFPLFMFLSHSFQIQGKKRAKKL